MRDTEAPYSFTLLEERRRYRRLTWATVVAVVTSIAIVVGLYTVPVRSIPMTGELTSLESSFRQETNTYGLDLDPPQSRCVSAESYECTNIWYAFNWSAPVGHIMSFEMAWMEGSGPQVYYHTVYQSTNSSFGGWVCESESVGCPGALTILTNDTWGLDWYLQCVVFYTYPGQAPLL